MECDLGGTAQKLIDGAWIEVPCDPESQHVCWTHKIRHNGFIVDVPERFKQELTQRELGNQIFERARETGTELQRAR